MYNLFLDDERLPKDVKWVELPLVCWVVVRSFDEFVKIITEKGLPKIIAFDHDLGDKAYQEVHWALNKKNLEHGTFNYDNLKGEKTGYCAAKWLVNYCLDKNLDLPEYFIHTMNPIGLENIKSFLESYAKSRK